MTDQLPPELDGWVSRIQAPEPVDAEVPAHVTGELRRLHLWWQGLSAGVPVRATVVRRSPLPASDTAQSLVAGLAAADQAIDSGATLLLPRVGTHDSTASRTLIALLTRKEASVVIHQPEGMTDRAWMASCAAVRDGVAALVGHRAQPAALLAGLDAHEIAFVVGALLGAAARRTPCLVDGTDELAAALVADRISFRAKGWWRAGSTSPDPARVAAIDRMDLTPGLPFGLTDDAGLGADATLVLLEMPALSGRD